MNSKTPAWFPHSAQHWSTAEMLYNQGLRYAKQGRQHARIGLLLLLIGIVCWGWNAWSTSTLTQGWAVEGALVMTGLLALYVRRFYRDNAETSMMGAMRMAVFPVLTTILGTDMSEDERSTLLNNVQVERKAGSPNSLRQLASAVIEGRLTGQTLREFNLLDGRMVFNGFNDPNEQP